MIKKNKLLFYQLKQDTGVMLFLLSIVVFILYIGNRITHTSALIGPENTGFITMFILCNNTAAFSFQKFGQYTAFGFCRRKFYHEQVILCLFRSILLSIFYSIYEFMNYNHFVNYFIEDTTDTPSMYHPVPLMELFLTNMCIFTLFYLICLVNISHTISIIFNKSEKTLQLNLRTQMKKQKYKWFYTFLTGIVKCISFVLFIGYIIGFQLYYQLQMQSSLSTRMIVLGILAVLCVVVYLEGRRRFRPKYV